MEYHTPWPLEKDAPANIVAHINALTIFSAGLAGFLSITL